MTNLERVSIRCVRLLLEGHVVAQPVRNSITAELNGQAIHPDVQSVLDGEPRWVRAEWGSVAMEILNRSIELPQVAVTGLVKIDDGDVAAIRDAQAGGASTEGLRLKFVLADPKDRLRQWLPDRFQGEELEVTPWGLPDMEHPFNST